MSESLIWGLFEVALERDIRREGNADVSDLVRRKEKFRKGDKDDWEV